MWLKLSSVGVCCVYPTMFARSVSLLMVAWHKIVFNSIFAIVALVLVELVNKKNLPMWFLLCTTASVEVAKTGAGQDVICSYLYFVALHVISVKLRKWFLCNWKLSFIWRGEHWGSYSQDIWWSGLLIFLLTQWFTWLF